VIGSDSSQRGHVRFALTLALGILAVSFAIAAGIDLFDEGEVVAPFALAAVVCGLAAGFIRDRTQSGGSAVPLDASGPAVMTMAALCWSVVAGGGAVAHLISNSTSNLNTAVLEGMAAATTTSMTALDPESLPMGVHMFRALMQWFGGLGGIVLAVVAIPMLLGSRELTGRAQAGGGAAALITGRKNGFGTLLKIYSVVTLIIMGAFYIAGMGPFNALVHGLATVSTGGLSTRTDSLAGFDSAAIEWVGIAAMTVAGLSIGAIWLTINKNWVALRRATEVRAFLGVLVASTAALTFWLGAEGGALTSLRRAALAASSAMSTTGFVSGDWAHFPNGAAALLIVLMTIGAMGGSAGGGVRYLRLIEAAGYARRELRLQLHPSAVGVVRVNGRAVDERTLQRLIGYLVAYCLVAGAGAALLALGDSAVGPARAATLAVSALSTTGTQTVDPAPLAELGGVSKWALAALMLLGRISIYSGIVAVATVVTRTRELAR